MSKIQEYKNIIDAFSNIKIGVIGDIVADISISGRPIKLSREAPVVVVSHEFETIIPGGAGNTVNNIAKLGSKVYPVCLIGEDDIGKKLVDYFSGNENVETNGLFVSKGDNTTTKTRILAGDVNTTKQQVLRIDKEPKYAIQNSLESEILNYIDCINEKVDAWVVSDYGYNLITPEVLGRIKKFSKEKTVVVDSRNRLREYTGVTIVAPNEGEAEISSGLALDNGNDIYAIGNKLLHELQTNAVLITRGNKGMVLFEKDGNITEIPVCGSKEVTDVTGAGDTVTSILSIANAAGATITVAAILANYGAAVAVMKSGTATVSREELIAIIEHDLSPEK